jgi:hypothetical protein
MEKNKQIGNWAFGILWIVANILGWSMRMWVARAAGWIAWEAYQSAGLGTLYRILSNDSIRLLIAMLIFGICWGAILGSLQYLVLKQGFSLEGKKWILATVIGVAISSILSGLASFAPYFLSSGIFLVVRTIVGIFTSVLFTLGVAQWFVLRRYFARSEWWLIVTAVASGLSTLVASIFIKGGQITIISSIVSQTTQGVLYGFVTLIVLLVVFKQKNKNDLERADIPQ